VKKIKNHLDIIHIICNFYETSKFFNKAKEVFIWKSNKNLKISLFLSKKNFVYVRAP